LKNKKHIFLIGFMGSGKTSLGKLIAKNLNINFIDTDNYIEDQEKSKIQEIFEEKGEFFFRKLEHEFIMNLL
jgi:shikimate kinase